MLMTDDDANNDAATQTMGDNADDDDIAADKDNKVMRQPAKKVARKAMAQ